MSKKKRIQVGSAKAKGRRLQKWVCKQVSQLTGLPWGKDEPIESRPMGQAGSDIRLDREAAELFPFAVECKYQETWSVPNWIRQARKNTPEGMNWLLFMKRNRFRPVVVLDARVFFDILEDMKMPWENRRIKFNYVRLVKETEIAWLLEGVGGGEERRWFTKLECKIDEDSKLVHVPEWLAVKKGLVEEW